MKPTDLDRLIKLCGMLGSEHDGERANAGRAATDLLKRLDLTWSEVLGKPPTVTAAEAQKPRAKKTKPQPPPPPPPQTREWARRAHDVGNSAFATEWERNFATSLLQQNRDYLTKRQAELLDVAWARCRYQSEQLMETLRNPRNRPFNPFST
jgi:hypothetical protein